MSRERDYAAELKRLCKFNDFIDFTTERIYDSEKVLNMPHVKRLLQERYLFQLPVEVIKNMDVDMHESIKVKRERLKEPTYGIEYDKLEFNTDGDDVYIESFKALSRRVARRIASGFVGLTDKKNESYITTKDIEELVNAEFINKFADKVEYLIANLYFLPSSPFMFNAMRGALDDPKIMNLVYRKGWLTFDEWVELYNVKDPAYGSCYAMGSIEDDIKSIYDMLYYQAEVFRHSGGFGANFSKLRSKHAMVSTIRGNSTGPVSFMNAFNQTTELIALHSSTRRGANMFILNSDHLEIYDFINYKTDFENEYRNLKYANLSVGIDNKFIDSVISDSEYQLKDPHDPVLGSTTRARHLWSNIVANAAMHAEPGLINFDLINADNPELYTRGPITSVNPCSEFQARDLSVCVLGSVNLYAFLKNSDTSLGYNFDLLENAASTLHAFLTISNFANDFPLPQLTNNTREMRNTGLGYMGLASTLVMVGKRYGSADAYEFLNEVMKRLNRGVFNSSTLLANYMGSYVGFREAVTDSIRNNRGVARLGSVLNQQAGEQLYEDDDVVYLLNTANPRSGVVIGKSDGTYVDFTDKIANLRLMAIAPTGSISFICQVSSGIEPIFSLAYTRKINAGTPNEYTTVAYDQAIYDYLRVHKGLDDDKVTELLNNLAQNGKLDMKLDDYVVNNDQISTEDRINMLYASDHWIDMNTSVTFNITKQSSNGGIDVSKLAFTDPAIDVFMNTDMDLEPYIKELLSDEHFRKAFIARAADWSNSEINASSVAELIETKEYREYMNVIKQVSNFYLLAQLLRLKGITVYVEGSRAPILTKVEKKKENKPQFTVEIDKIQKPQTPQMPKERPAILEMLKRTINITLPNGKVGKMFVELGYIDNEPFEIFFRPSESTKEYAELFEVVGRLISVSVRSGVKMQVLLEQLRKTKTYGNTRDGIVGIMYGALSELVSIATASAKRRRELIKQDIDTSKWVMQPKGYYLDENGKRRCPVCKNEVVSKDGCISCSNCGWSACV